MRILITAGPTREPIDPVRYISNYSSGRMGVALVQAALAAHHSVTAILGPISFDLPAAARRIDVQSTREMHDAVLREFPSHDVLIMAAAVADYRPCQVADHKLGRGGRLVIELEPTEDIVAAAAQSKGANQWVIGFSLEAAGDLARARQKLARKKLDLIVFNPLQTMNSPEILATLLYADGRQEPLAPVAKEQFAQILIQRLSGLHSPA